MNADKKLEELRGRIDALDEQIQSLINARAGCAAEVAEVKAGQGEDTHFYRPEREAAILRRVSDRNEGRCLPRKWYGCSARSCRPALRWRNR